MTAIPARRRRRLIAAVTTSILSVIALPSGLVLGANSLLHDSGGNNVESAVTVDIPTNAVEMLAVLNARNEVSSLSLIAITPQGKGGTIVSIPVGAATDVAKDELATRIGDAYVEGGLDAVRFEVESLLNITVNVADDVTATELAALLAPIGSQPLTLAQPLFDTDAAGTTVTLLPAGPSTATATQIASGLAASQVGIPESNRLPQVKALWNAVARGGVAAPIETESTTTVPTASQNIDAPSLATTQEFITSLLAGEVDVWQFSATLMTDAQRNPQNLDLYSVDGGEVLMVMASVAPGSLNLTSNNIAIMIDVPFNNSTFAREAVTRLAYMGANIVLVRQVSDIPAEHTVVYFNDSLAKTEGETYSSLLGALEFVQTPDVISGVNLRIVLGNDFVAFLGSGASSSSTTSTTGPK